MKKLNKTDYIVYCEGCGEALINLGNFYAHPSNNCVEIDDGVQVIRPDDSTFAKEFAKKYGKPSMSSSKIIEELIKLANEYYDEIVGMRREIDLMRNKSTKKIKSLNNKIKYLEGDLKTTSYFFEEACEVAKYYRDMPLTRLNLWIDRQIRKFRRNKK